MSFSILAWNVRGLGRYDKRVLIKDIVSSSSVELLILVESKMRSIPPAFMHQVCPFPLVNGLCLPSKGSASSIWVLWDTSKVEILNSWVKDFSVSVYGCLRNSEVGWMVTGIYGPYSSKRKLAFFQELYDTRSLWNGPGVYVEILMKSFARRIALRALCLGE